MHVNWIKSPKNENSGRAQIFVQSISWIITEGGKN